MTGSPRFIHLDDLPWQEVRRQRHGDREVSVREKWLDFCPGFLSLYAKWDPGMIVQPHGHNSNHVVYVLEGEMTCGEVRCVKGTHIALDQGDTFGPFVAGADGVELFEVMMGDPRSFPADLEGYSRFLAERGVEQLPNPPIEMPFGLEDTRSLTRIPDPAPGELRADVEELLPLIARPGGKPASTMVVLARSPDLLAPFLGWAAALALNGVLSNRDHELLALRAAHNCRSKFEWDEHSDYARDAGLTDAEIALVSRPIGDGGWSPSEAALLQATDDLVATHDVADETWAVLASYYDTPALSEILFVVGQYTMLSMVANGAGIDG